MKPCNFSLDLSTSERENGWWVAYGSSAARLRYRRGGGWQAADAANDRTGRGVE